ncbi:TPA: hypothetical protein N0F65_009226, partial [Lagenidium giganteum]
RAARAMLPRPAPACNTVQAMAPGSAVIVLCLVMAAPARSRRSQLSARCRFDCDGRVTPRLAPATSSSAPAGSTHAHMQSQSPTKQAAMSPSPVTKEAFAIAETPKALEEGQDGIPQDIWDDMKKHDKFIYLSLMFLNGSVLWAFYSCLSAQNYFQNRFPEVKFEFLTTLVASWPMFFGHFIQVFFGVDKMVSQYVRIQFGFLLSLAMAVLIMVFSAIDFGNHHTLGSTLVLACFTLIGFANSLSESGFYTLAALFPVPKYSNAVQIGNVASGILNITIATVIRLIVGGIKQAESSVSTSFYIFFGLLLAVCIAAIFLFHRIMNLPCVRFLSERNQASTKAQELDSQSLGCRLRNLWRIFRIIWIPTLVQFIVFFVSLSVFPGFGCTGGRILDPKVNPNISEMPTSANWYCAPGIIGSYNYGDFFGRVFCTAAVYKVVTMKLALGMSILRIAYIPLLLMGVFGSSFFAFNGIDITSPLIYSVLLNFTIGITNGVLVTVTMGMGPRMVAPEDRESAGAILVLGLFLGIASGSTFGYEISTKGLLGLCQCDQRYQLSLSDAMNSPKQHFESAGTPGNDDKHHLPHVQLEDGGDGIPPEIWDDLKKHDKFIYFSLMFLNGSVLWAFYSCLSAQNYFQVRFPEVKFEFLTTLAVSWPMFFGHFIQVAFGVDKMITQRTRIQVGFLISFAMAVLIMVFSAIDFGNHHTLGSTLVLLCFALIGFANSLSESGFYTVAVLFPVPKYSNAVQIGNATSGILNITVATVIRLIVGGIKQTDSSVSTSFYLFFSLLLVVCVTAIFLFRHIMNLRPLLASTKAQELDSQSLGCRLRNLWRIFRIIWIPTLVQFIVFFVSLSVFPGFGCTGGRILDPKVNPNISEMPTSANWYCAPGIIGSYNYGDFFGRVFCTAAVYKVVTMKLALGMSILRIAYIPLLLMGVFGSSFFAFNGIDITSPLIYSVLLNFTIGITNGVLVTVTMGMGPRMVAPEDRESAGAILVLGLFLGIASGSTFGYEISTKGLLGLIATCPMPSPNQHFEAVGTPVGDDKRQLQHEEHTLEDGGDGIPQDIWNDIKKNERFIFFSLTFLNGAVLWAFFSCLSAQNFYQQRFKSVKFSFLTTLWVLFGLDKVLSHNVRIISGFTIFATMAVTVIVLGCFAIIGGANSLSEAVFYAISALFPVPKFTNAVQIGSVSAGVINITAATLLPLIIGGVHQTSDSTSTSFYLFFSLLVIVSFAAILVFRRLWTLKCIQFLVQRNDASTRALRLNSQSIGARLCNLARIFRVIWLPAIAQFLIFFVSLTVYPGFGCEGSRILVPDVNPHVKSVPTSIVWYCAPGIIGSYSFGDFLGRVMCTATVYKVFTGHLCFALTVLRFAYIPLLLMGVYGTSFFVFGGEDLVSPLLYNVAVNFSIGLTNGVLAVFTMGIAPRMVGPDDRESAGAIMVFFLFFGLATGSLFGFFVSDQKLLGLAHGLDAQKENYVNGAEEAELPRRRRASAVTEDDDDDAEGLDQSMDLTQELSVQDNGAAEAPAQADGESEMGVIEEIYCENFMCHRKMRVKLSPHINFITGENGSGKSAIIAAIQICLGASARSTHRGKSIKNLIRHGHEGNALVRITLRNDARGSDAFRAETFGKRIMVERIIRRDGSAEYRLKNDKGVLVSKLKTDLEAMLDHLNIQTENPCAILDQENAKLFLKGNPTDKYKFFLQSTDLYKMRTTYSKIDEETRAISDSVLKRERIKINALKEAMDEAVQRWDDAQSIGKLEAEFTQLKKELAWSFVREKELEALKVEKKMKIKQRDEAEIREKYTAVSNTVKSLEDKQKTKNNELEKLNMRARENQRMREAAKNSIREARKPLHSYKAELKQLSQQRDRAHQRIARLERDINHKRQQHEEMLASRKARNSGMRERVERKRHEVARIEEELNDVKHRAVPDSGNLDDLEHQHDNCVRQLRDAENEVGRIQRRIASLKAQKRDSLAVFGPKIPQLQQMIQENLHRFAEPPIGPLGVYVKLPERFKHLAVAIEVALKGTLQSYLVVNGRDKALLDDLKRRVGCASNQATIIIAKRTGKRYENLRLAEGSLTAHALCNILEVSNDEVFNALIDVCSTESKLLFNDRESAEANVLRGSSGNFRMARFVSEVYLPSGDKFVVRSGNLAYIANKGSRRSSIICTDVEGEIQELEQKLHYAQGSCDVIRRDESKLREEKDIVLHNRRRMDEQINRLTHQYNQVRVQLRNLEDELSDDVQQQTLDTSVLEDELEEVHKEIASYKQREIDLNEMLSKFNPDLEDLLKNLEDLSNEENEIGEEMQELQEDVDGLYKHLSEMKIQELRYEREAAAVSEFVTQWASEHAQISEECEELRRKACLHCGSDERIEVTESRDYYGKRLTDIKRKIEKERGRFQGMDLDELQMDMEEKTLKYEKKKATYDKFAQNLRRIRSMLEERKAVWQILRKEIAHRTSMEFNKYMYINNFAGKLKFRHDDQRLEITVLHNEKGRSRASQVTDMKELSGGERSYTQVSLLLALGESIECPFRVMDGFDVFMDSVNRDMTIQLLVDAAKKDCKKQFIFVTPNDLSALRKDPMVKIQKMDPPRDPRANNNMHSPNKQDKLMDEVDGVLEEGQDGIPQDIWDDMQQNEKFIYHSLMFLNGSVLWGFYSCLSAQTFFADTFKKEESDLDFNFLTTLVTAWPMVIGHVIQVIFAIDKKFGQQKRVILGFCIFMTMAVCIMIFSAITWQTDGTPPGVKDPKKMLGATLVLVCFGIVGAANSLSEATFYTLAALFPVEKFTNGVQIGNVMAGVLNITINTIIRLIVGGVKQTGNSASTSFYIFFALLVIVCIAAIMLYRRLVNLPCIKFLLERNEEATRAHGLANQSMGATMWNLARIFRQIWMPAIVQFLVFFVSLSVFPGFGCSGTRILDPKVNKHLEAPPTSIFWSCAPGIIGTYNYGDFFGRIACTAAVYKIFNMKLSFALTMLRLAFIPLMLMGVAGTSLYIFGGSWTGSGLTLVGTWTDITTPLIYNVIMTLVIGFSNGLLSTVTMGVAPRLVGPDDRESAGAIMVFFLFLGIASGATFGFEISENHYFGKTDKLIVQEASHLEEGQDGIPQEIWDDMKKHENFIYYGLMFLNGSVLWAYYSCLSAQDFYKVQFEGSGVNFEFLTTLITAWPMVGGFLLQMIFAIDKKVSQQKRVNIGYCIFIAMALTIMILSAVHWKDNMKSTGAWLVLTCFGVIGFSNSLSEATFYTLAALFPVEKFTNGVQIGNVCAGILNITVNTIIRLAVGGVKQKGDSTKTSFYIFFSLLIMVCVAALVLYRRMVNLPCIKFLLERNEESTRNLGLANQSIGATLANLARIFKQIWVPAIAQFLIFFVSLAVFPGFGCTGTRILVPGVNTHLTAPPTSINWYCAPGIIGAYNYGDFFGRIACTAAVYRIFTMKISFILTLLRLVFIPLMLMGVAGTSLYVFGGSWKWAMALDPVTNTMVNTLSGTWTDITSPLIYNVIMTLIIGFTNGLLCTVTMGVAPRLVGPDDRESAGAIMVFFLFLGIAGGATLGYEIGHQHYFDL